MAFFGSFLFNLVFYLSLIPITLIVISLYPFISSEKLQKVGSYWILFVLYTLKILCGVKWRVEGYSNIPKKPYIVVSNHQGQWESLFLQTLFIPSTTIIKRELLFIPLFGWALVLMKPITLNRKKKYASLKKVIKKGINKLNDNFSLILFPEGTRIAPDKGVQPFANSCGLLSIKSGVPVLPICHNSGVFWENKKFIKKPGMVVIKIGEPITGNSAKDITDRAYAWIKNTYEDLED